LASLLKILIAEKSMVKLNVRPCALLLSFVSLVALSSYAMAQEKGGGASEDDDTIIVGGGVHTPDPVPEPFTMVLGAGAIALYARHRVKKNRAAVASVA
jgi:hypothetical protein